MPRTQIPAQTGNPSPRKRWFRRAGTLLLWSLPLVGVGLAAPQVVADQPEPRSTQPAPKRVRAVAASAVEHATIRSYAGQLRSIQRAELAATVGARLLHRPVEIGDVVRNGQIVARLDDRQYRNARRTSRAVLGEVEARLRHARRDLGRAQQLHGRGWVAVAELDREEASVDELEASKRAAQTAIREQRRLERESVLRAPFDGIVSAVHFEPGETVPPGAPVVTLTGTSGLEIEVEVAESTRATLRVSDRVEIRLPLADVVVGGSIAALSAAADGVGHLFPVLVSLDEEPRAHAGMTADVLFRARPRELLAVPVPAVVSPGAANASVFVVRDGRIERVAVDVVELTYARALVRGSLSAGEAVVTGGHSALAPNDEVEVAS